MLCHTKGEEGFEDWVEGRRSRRRMRYEKEKGLKNDGYVIGSYKERARRLCKIKGQEGLKDWVEGSRRRRIRERKEKD